MQKRNLIKRLTLILFLISWPLSAHPNSYYYIVNDTGHYLHVLIDDESYPFLAPGKELEAEGDDEVRVVVYYSPGQKISGEARRTLYSDNYGADCDCQEGRYKNANSWVVSENELH